MGSKPLVMEPSPPTASTRWFLIRLAFVAFFAASGSVLARGTDGPSAWLLVVVFSAMLYLTVSLLRQEVRRVPTSADWSRPTWFTNPFSGPVHGFHLGSFQLIGLGATATVLAFHRHRSFFVPLFFLAAGLGMYGGLRIFYKFFYDDTPKA